MKNLIMSFSHTVKLPEIVEVIQYAVIKAMGLFPKAKFVLAGHSAGAHLIANILCGDNRISKDQGILERIAGFALFSGIYDIRPVQRTILNDALDLSM
jgi:arylformamidase